MAAGGVASLLDGVNQVWLRSQAGIESDAGGLGKKVDVGSLHAGHAGQRGLDSLRTVGASQTSICSVMVFTVELC